MPQTVDEEKFKTRMSFDVSRPNDPNVGIPMMQIPHMEFPRVIYKWPKDPFKKIEHRNAMHEIVDIEMVQAEALTKKVENDSELKHALKEGWSTKPYIPPPLPDPNANLYSGE